MTKEEFNAIKTPRTDAVAANSDRITYPLRMHKIAEDMEREVALLERALKECADYGDEPSIATLRMLAAIRSAVERANEKEKP